jgi:membrane-bound lytic murein transglycosylase B
MTHRRRRPRLLPILPLFALFTPAAHALDESREDVRAFIAELREKHGFDQGELVRVFAEAQSQPSIVEAISRPAEKTLTWAEYRAKFLTERRIDRGLETWAARNAELERAAARGVPAEVVLAITGVETFYGENTGRHRVVDALATLAFDYPPRSPFFRAELEQYLLMAREEVLDPLQPQGSYAGAMGIPQFMPSSFRRYAVDGDGDGKRNLWASWGDVFASVANYLLEHDWRAGEPVMTAADVSEAKLDGMDLDKVELNETVGSLRGRGVKFATTLPDDAPAVLLDLRLAEGHEYRVGFRNFYAITRYNRSELYASAVNDLAEALRAARVAVAPKADAVPATASGNWSSGP